MHLQGSHSISDDTSSTLVCLKQHANSYQVLRQLSLQDYACKLAIATLSRPDLLVAAMMMGSMG